MQGYACTHSYICMSVLHTFASPFNGDVNYDNWTNFHHCIITITKPTTLINHCVNVVGFVIVIVHY
jgi:hypothetical protein